MTEREKFETWAKAPPHEKDCCIYSEGDNLEDDDLWYGQYCDHPTQLAWEAWQEARGQWIDVDKEWPAIGEKVILFANGVVQDETYEFDQGDNGFGGGEHFWGRDDVDDCPKVESGQFWMPLPAPPQTTEKE